MMRDHFQRRSRASSPTRREERQSWYSTPPRLQIYDREVINVLLNLARLHLSSTFQIFSNFEATATTKEELCLAMAAVGALFCGVRGKTKVAQKLNNDARRILLETILQNKTSGFEMHLSDAMTFILLDIYGICSGDKRCYELVEAFQGLRLQVVASCFEYSHADIDFGVRQQLDQLHAAVCVLDSYRVLLMSRPPSFVCLAMDSAEDHCGTFMSRNGIKNTAIGCMHSLATLCSYSWMSSPQGLQTSSQPVWKSEFVEFAMDRWIRSKSQSCIPSDPSEVSQMLLYHLGHIRMHTNLRVLQQSVTAFSASEKNVSPNGRAEEVQTWTASSNFEIAVWHAEKILQLAKTVIAVSRHRGELGKGKPTCIEPPHLPFCVYFATLVSWYGATVASKEQSSANFCIERGTQLLFALKMRVATQLGEALSELLQAESRDEN